MQPEPPHQERARTPIPPQWFLVAVSVAFAVGTHGLLRAVLLAAAVGNAYYGVVIYRKWRREGAPERFTQTPSYVFGAERLPLGWLWLALVMIMTAAVSMLLTEPRSIMTYAVCALSLHGWWLIYSAARLHRQAATPLPRPSR